MRYLYRSRESPHAKHEEAHANRNAVDDGSLEENQHPREMIKLLESKMKY